MMRATNSTMVGHDPKKDSGHGHIFNSGQKETPGIFAYTYKEIDTHTYVRTPGIPTPLKIDYMVKTG